MRIGNATGCKAHPRRRRARLPTLTALLVALTPLPLASAAQTRSNFDHRTTSFELLGQHRDLPCEACHANAVFKGTPTECGACHGIGTAVRATAKPTNHLLSTDQCQSCHTSWAWKPAVDFDHTQVRGGCAACHNGVSASGMPGNHIPVSAAGVAPIPCEGCHSTANYPVWAGTQINHAAAAALACAACHETAAFLGMIPSTNTAAGDSRPNATLDPLHPTSGDCGQCHVTASFAASASRPPNHIPTSAPCVQCHTTAGNYAAYVMGATGHAGITNNCAQCHAYGLSFYNMAPPTLKEPASGATGHIPAVPPNGSTVIACELCHSPSAFTTFSGTVMKHAYVASMKCEACHEFGMAWQTNVGVQLWTRPEPDHHAGQDCNGAGCHTARDKLMVRPVPTPHASTPATPATTVDHAQIVGSCVSCHNGTLARGKGLRHVATAVGCDRCHTTNAWLPARFDHAAIAAHTCATCHNGVQTVGMARSHIPTTQQCDACHGTLAWTPALVDHSAFAGACARCHNGSAAIGLSPGHLQTRLDCSTCHGYPQWSAVQFRHTSAAYPGDHVRALACTACHGGNSDRVSYAGGNSGTCAGCHAAVFRPTAHRKTVKGQLYTVSELANCSGACHVYGDASLSVIAKSLPGPHHRVVDATFRR